MNAVKRPRSLYFSAIAVVLAQTLLANFGSVAAGGSFLLDCAATSSITPFLASTGPPPNMSCHLLSVGRAFLSPRKPRGLLGTERRATAAGIDRPRGVDVLVAEVRALGVIPACVRRVA